MKTNLSLFDEVIVELENDLKPKLRELLGREYSFLDLFCTKHRDSLGLSATGVLTQAVAFDPSSGTDRKTDLHTGRLIAITSLVPGLKKRYIGPTCGESNTASDREALALSEFIEDNDRCQAYNDAYAPSLWNGFVQEIRGEVIDILHDALETHGSEFLSHQYMGTHLAVGPGSSSDHSGDSSFYSKLGDSEMSFSSRAVQRTFKMLARMTQNGMLTEAVRCALHGRHDSIDSCAVFVSVLKTNLKNRGICTQPSGNMSLQLATHSALSEILKFQFDCDLSIQQSLNGQLAYWGSKGQINFLNFSWNFCTFDLSRASNFPWVLVQDMFPERWVRWFRHVRSPRMRFSDGSEVEKHMCSTMGNGFTFSLMTLFLSAIVRALYRFAGLPEHDIDPLTGKKVKTWAVYGDDIIVDKRVANGLQQVLAAFGFLINRSKSYSEGLFRESCGQDYYDGYPVRPVFCESLETQADVFSLLNRLALWGVQHSVALPRALSLLRRTADSLGPVLRVPNTEDVSHGLHVPFDRSITVQPNAIPPFLTKLKGQAGHDGAIFQALAPKTNRIRLNTERIIRRHVSFLSPEYFLNGPVALRVLYSGTAQVEVETEWRSENLFAFLLGTVSGSIRQGQYSLRSPGGVEYQLRWMYAPSWGLHSLYGGTASCARTGTAKHVYALWEEYVRVNICMPPKRAKYIGPVA